MVETASTYVHKLLRELEKFLIKKNEFHLSGETYEIILLIPTEKYSPDSKYSLVLSAKALNDFSQKDVIREIFTSFKEALDVNEYNSITRINVIHTADPLVKGLKMMFGFREEMFELNNITVGGVNIDFAYLIKSLVLDKLIEGRALSLEIIDPEGNPGTIKAGIIRIDRDYKVVYYTGKGLKAIFAPDMSEKERSVAERLKNENETYLIQHNYISSKKLDEIVKVV